MSDPATGNVAGNTLGNPAATGNVNAGGAAGQQDALDKGVDYALKQSGHQQGASTTEKISDGIRSGFKKLSGKDVPIQDKQ
ncbi:hypothetical protein IAU59_004540 [Kwoniella sp. CBS 9459]